MNAVIRISLLFALGPLLARGADATPVKIATVARGDVIRYVTLPGTLRADQQATLYAKVAGYVTKVAVDKGDSVKADQLLAELEVPELIGDFKKYEADAKVAEIELLRMTGAQKKAPDLVLPQALDKARGASDVAVANLQRTQTLLDFAKITAPFAGVVTMRFVDNGAFVPAATSGGAQNAAIFTVMNFTTVRAQAAVPELDAALVKNGQPVKVTLEALGGKTIDAKVSRFSQAIDETTRTMLVEADIPNPDLALRPGMYATIKVGVEQHADALVVPVDALAMEKTNAFIFKLAEGKAKKTAVTLGFNDGAKVEILTGVGYGESVILVGKATLNDGQAVQPEMLK
ncbi:MAG: efflux RND transporter periplasmic adaptor subunit [Chthoniobacteraceae bacterium]